MGLSPGPGHRFEPRLRPQCHQCLWIRLTAASMWVKVAQLPYWPSRGRQVLHQRWIWGIACRQESMQASPPWLWNPGQTSPEVQTGVSVAPQKGHVSSKKFKKKKLKLVQTEAHFTVKIPVWSLNYNLIQLILIIIKLAEFLSQNFLVKNNFLLFNLFLT